MENLNQLAGEIRQNAIDKGFYEKPVSDATKIMLVITEMSEALEAHRCNRRTQIKSLDEYVTYLKKYDCCDEKEEKVVFSAIFSQLIKDTLEDELADAYIRILDFCAYKEIDVDSWRTKILSLSMDAPTEWLRGLSFGDNLFVTCKVLICGDNTPKEFSPYYMVATLTRIEAICEADNIDLDFHIRMKMRYNATREFRHGKEY